MALGINNRIDIEDGGSSVILSGFTTNYTVGQSFNITSGTITRNGVQASAVASAYEGRILDASDDGKSFRLYYWVNGTQYFTDKLVISVTANDWTITSIAVNENETKQSYFQGDIFNYSDIVLDVAYASQGNNGTITRVKQLRNLENYSLSSVVKLNGEGEDPTELSDGEVLSSTWDNVTIKFNCQVSNFSENGNNYNGDHDENITYAISVTVGYEDVEFGIDIDTTATNPYLIKRKVNGSLSGNAVGYIEIGDKNKGVPAKVVFTTDLPNLTKNSSNVTVEFPSYTKGLANRINHCTFGKIFNNQLFVSGNSTYPNTDWHSQPVNTTEQPNTNDLTYFSDLDYCNYGNNDTKVVGYDTYRDGDLIVFKEDSKAQATIYRRTAALVQATNYAGERLVDENGALYETQYPSFEINTNGGEGALSHNSIANLMGSTLFLTKNGLKLLSSKETTYNNARYTYDTSSHINFVLKNHLSKNDKVYTFKEKLFLIADNKVYMAFSGVGIENELEWFPIDLGFVPYTMFEIDDEIYFANNDGNIYRFNDDEYYYNDRTTGVYGQGHLIKNTTDSITIDGETLSNADRTDETNESMRYAYSINNDDKAYIQKGTRIQLLKEDGSYFYNLIHTTLSEDIYEQTIEGEETARKYLKISSPYFSNGVEFYIYRNNTYKRIVLQQINDNFQDYDLFDLIDDSGQRWEVALNDAFYIRLDENHPTFIGNFSIDEDDFVDVSIVDGNDRDIYIEPVMTGQPPLNFNECKVLIYQETPVKAYYKTKTFDFGTNVYEKTIWGFVLANDSGLKSETMIGYISSRKQNEFNFEVDASQLNLQGFRFDEVQFDNDGLPHVYSKYRVIPRVSFIRFLFKNDNSTNLVLSELSLLYTISRLTRGIK